MKRNRMIVWTAAALAAIVAGPMLMWGAMKLTGASPVVYVEQDGSHTIPTFGPTARWPDWVPAPAGSTVDVESAFLNDRSGRGTASPMRNLTALRPRRRARSSRRWRRTAGRLGRGKYKARNLRFRRSR